MNPRFLQPSARSGQNAVALLMVLAFLVLLAAMVIAYLGRTAIDRRVAHTSFNDAKSDELARASLDIIVADLKQEIMDGSTISVIGGTDWCEPRSSSNIVPMRSGNPAGSPDPIPNLIRRSVRNDSIPAPGIASRASAVNSATDISLNGRSVTAARWNKHYLIPKLNTSNDWSDPVSSFAAPDWVFVTNTAGPTVISSPVPAVLGRYAYAIYNEGGLLDVNVAGFPSPTPNPVSYVGRKGTVAFADLTALPTTGSSFVSNTAINRIIGWRNYASVRPSESFPAFTFTSTATQNFVNYFLDTARDFRTTATTISGGRTDQNFITRATLIEFRAATGASVNMLQHVGTFSRELNAPTFRISPTGPLAQRFGIGKLAEVAPNPSNPAVVKSDFGLVWNADHWEYWGQAGSSEQSSIPAITGSNPPDFFQLLSYEIG